MVTRYDICPRQDVPPRQDFPWIETPEQLEEFKHSCTEDLRRMKHVSFLRALDAEDSRMHKHQGQPFLITPTLYIEISLLYDMLVERGFRNIFFATQSDLIEHFKIQGKRPNRDLLNKLDNLQSKMVLRYYTYTKSNCLLIKIVLNPLYGFVFQKDAREYIDEDGNIFSPDNTTTTFYSVFFQAVHSYYLPFYTSLPSYL